MSSINIRETPRIIRKVGIFRPYCPPEIWQWLADAAGIHDDRQVILLVENSYLHRQLKQRITPTQFPSPADSRAPSTQPAPHTAD